MQNPDERAAETRMRETGVIPAESFERDYLEPVESAPPPYVKEPLFNKKVMLAWALGAFAVWFAVSMIVPIAMESAKTSIREAVQEVDKGSDGTITIRRNGKVISITRGKDPQVIVTPDPAALPAGSAVPPATVAPPAPTLPPVPVEAPARKR